MTPRDQVGQVNPMLGLILVGLVIAGVWIWKRLPPDTQDAVVEQGVPLAAAGAVLFILIWIIVRRLKRRKRLKADRAKLLARFERETAPAKRFDLACALVELNEFRREGLETVTAALETIFTDTLNTALGDKQHRLRGMAVSYLSVLQDKAVVPLLMKTLEDDHWWVRSQAALALGRLRAGEARSKLTEMATDDWDQTVRSRCREALERIE